MTRCRRQFGSSRPVSVHGRSRCRAGFSLVEVLIGLLLLGVVTSLLLPTLRLSGAQHDRTRYLTLCLTELQNLQHDILQRHEREQWATEEELQAALTAAGSPDGIRLSDWFRREYPDAELSVVRLPDADVGWDSTEAPGAVGGELPVRALRVSITRFPGEIGDSQKKSLVMWVY